MNFDLKKSLKLHETPKPVLHEPGNPPRWSFGDVPMQGQGQGFLRHNNHPRMKPRSSKVF